MDFFIKPGALVYNFLQLNNKYFKTGMAPSFYVDSPETDFTSVETQLKLI